MNNFDTRKVIPIIHPTQNFRYESANSIKKFFVGKHEKIEKPVIFVPVLSQSVCYTVATVKGTNPLNKKSKLSHKGVIKNEKDNENKNHGNRTCSRLRTFRRSRRLHRQRLRGVC